jgi:hypothetical protein
MCDTAPKSGDRRGVAAAVQGLRLREADVTDFIYNAKGSALGFARGNYIYRLSGQAIGQLRGTHVHKLTGAYVDELHKDMVLDKRIGNLGNIGNSGNPGNAGNPGNPGVRGAVNYGYPDAFDKLLS